MPNCVHGMDSRFCAVCANPGRTAASRRKAVQLRASGQQPKNEAEREAYEAVYAYEEALSNQKGKTTRANRTWPMIREHGIIGAVERIVTRRTETEGYRVLVEMGLEDMAFEAVVLRHPDSFSPAAVVASKDRLQRLKTGCPLPNSLKLKEKPANIRKQSALECWTASCSRKQLPVTCQRRSVFTSHVLP